MATSVSLDDIQGLYIAYFNRPADFSGLKFWQNAANAAGGDLSTVANAFSSSAEYTDTYAGKTNFEIIDQIYVNLFGRHAELDGLVFWNAALENGLGVGKIAYQIFKGAQNEDLVAVGAKVSAATAFYGALDTSAEVIGYSGTAANAVVKAWLAGIIDQDTLDAATSEEGLSTVTAAAVAAHDAQVNPPTKLALTTGVDTLVGTAGNDTFVAGDGEWTALDSLDGGAGVNTLTVGQSTTLTIPTGAVLKNIQTVNLATGGNLTGSLASNAVNTVNVTVAGTTTLTANAATDVNQLAASDDTTITGGKNVVINQTDAAAVAQSTNAAGNVTITTAGNAGVTNAGGAIVANAAGNVTATGGTSLTTTVQDGVSYADVQAHIAAAAATESAKGAATTAASTAATVLTNLQTMAASIAGASTTATVNAATLLALSQGRITAAQKASIDAEFAKALPTNAAAAQAAALAVYDPLVKAAQTVKATADATVISATAADATADGVVTDDAAIGGGTVANTTNTKLASVSVNGNVHGAVNITDGSTLSTVLTTVSLNNAGGATLIGNGISTVNLKDQFNNVAITNNTAAHALTVTADNVDVTVADANAGTVNLVSNGTAGSKVIVNTTAGATAVNITGAGALDLTGSSFAANAVITATNSAGAHTVTVGAGQQYLGGSGVDTVTAGGVLQTAAVSGGAGAADKLILTANANFATDAAAALFSGFEVLQVGTGVAANVTKFTNSTITSVVLDAATATAGVSGLTAAQAAAVTVASSGTYTIGVTGADTVGQLDTVSLKIDNSTAGRQAVALTAPVLTGVEVLNITNNENTTISALTSATALTNVNVSGAGTFGLTTGALALNVNTIIDAHLVTRAVTIDAGASLANGLKIVGSATAANNLTSNALNSVLVGGDGGDTLTGGAGNDVITSGNGTNSINAGAGANTITVGNGINTITTVGSTGVNTVTAGNGYNTITTGSGNDIIKVGTGGNTISSGAGADVITLGAHTLGTVDTIIFGASATVAGAAGANMDTINGFLSGIDKLQLSTGSLDGITLTGTSSVTVGSAVSVAASVATVTDVYTQLGTALTGWAASTIAAGGINAREVVFTTGDAAGTYLIINDSAAGFQGATDVVIKLVGTTAIAAGDFTVV